MGDPPVKQARSLRIDALRDESVHTSSRSAPGRDEAIGVLGCCLNRRPGSRRCAARRRRALRYAALFRRVRPADAASSDALTPEVAPRSGHAGRREAPSARRGRTRPGRPRRSQGIDRASGRSSGRPRGSFRSGRAASAGDRAGPPVTPGRVAGGGRPDAEAGLQGERALRRRSRPAVRAAQQRTKHLQLHRIVRDRLFGEMRHGHVPRSASSGQRRARPAGIASTAITRTGRAGGSVSARAQAAGA